MNLLILQIIQVFIFFLPAAFANMAPVLFKKINFLNKPINSKLFGSHKTYRGFLFGILIAILIVCIQYLLLDFLAYYYIIDYAEVNLILLGFLLGFGALLGDLVKSFFKRKLDIAPGKSWPVFDQIDWILGSIIVLNFYVYLSFKFNLIAIVLFGVLHPIVNYIGYILKIKKNKF